MKNKNNELIKILYECATACYNCVDGCLDEDANMMAECIRTDLDCADICTTVASFLARGSVHGKHLLSECIEICKNCATECEKHDHDHCKECARICRECIAACEKYRAA